MSNEAASGMPYPQAGCGRGIRTWPGMIVPRPRRGMIDGISIFAMPTGDLLFLAANGAIYFGLGVGFKFFERQARERGKRGSGGCWGTTDS